MSVSIVDTCNCCKVGAGGLLEESVARPRAQNTDKPATGRERVSSGKVSVAAQAAELSA
jgi:hypothetical protein